MSDLSVMGLAEVLPHLPRLVRRINQTAAEARRLAPDAVVTVDFAELLHAARASAPRLGHSHRALRRAATLGVASRPRQEAWAARQPHHGFAAVRGVFFRQIRHSLDLCRPPGHRDGCRSRRRPGLQGPAWTAGGRHRALRASRLEKRRGAPPHPRLWRGPAQPQGGLPGSPHRHSGGPCRGRNRAHTHASLAVPGRVRRDGRALRCLRRFRRRPGQIGHRHPRAGACQGAHGGRLQGQPPPPPSSSAAWA